MMSQEEPKDDMEEAEDEMDEPAWGLLAAGVKHTADQGSSRLLLLSILAQQSSI